MEEQILRLIESLIFATEHPLSILEIQQYLSVYLDQPVEEKIIEDSLKILTEKYDSADFSFQIINTGGGHQFLTKPAFHQLVATLNGDKFSKKLSATSMETLSIIAYRQPVTKSEIEYIRGVSSDYSIQKLLEKELIYIKGRKEDAIGKPLLYATTTYFMDYLGINDVSELPRLKEMMTLAPPEDEIMAENKAVLENRSEKVDSTNGLMSENQETEERNMDE